MFSNKFKKNQIYFLILIIILLNNSCYKFPVEQNDYVYNVPILNDTSIVSKLPVVNEGPMLQAFYWNCEPAGEWWNTLSALIPTYAAIGIKKLWLPAISKGGSGTFSMGYDPLDYFDFGEFNQNGSKKTRFGSRAELEALIAKAHSYGLEIIVDMVLGHNNGGKSEKNPYRNNKQTWTNFNVASGKFIRNANDFHPNDRCTQFNHCNDAGADFFAEQDLCHDQPNVQKWLWAAGGDSSVAKYYKNVLKIDGWRFDYVKSFAPWVVKEFLKVAGGFAVGELWEGNVDALNQWSNDANCKAFDFANFYTMKAAFDWNQMTKLRDDRTMRSTNPFNAVTFVGNHDTDKDPNPNAYISQQSKLGAYAFLFTVYGGYPCIFYSDIVDKTMLKKINKLILIYKTLSVGDYNVLYADNDEFVAQRKGNGRTPGLVIYINNSKNKRSRDATTHWKNALISDYTENDTTTLITDANGDVPLTAPAGSYTIWSLSSLKTTEYYVAPLHSTENWGVTGTATSTKNFDTDDPNRFVFDKNAQIFKTTLNLTAGEIKFRKDNAWTTNFGNNGNGETLFAGGGNIKIGEAGNYTIYFDYGFSNSSITKFWMVKNN